MVSSLQCFHFFLNTASQDHVLIDLSDEGHTEEGYQFTNADERDTPYISWARYQPNNVDHHCVKVNPSVVSETVLSDVMMDIDCLYDYARVCERERKRTCIHDPKY